jgi:hypothetical protein
VVSLQDNIWVESDGLQKFWDDYQATGGLVSGVGDQYEEIDTRGKPTIVCWNDPRKKTNKHGTFFYECVWLRMELGCHPTKIIFYCWLKTNDANIMIHPVSIACKVCIGFIKSILNIEHNFSLPNGTSLAMSFQLI